MVAVTTFPTYELSHSALHFLNKLIVSKSECLVQHQQLPLCTVHDFQHFVFHAAAETGRSSGASFFNMCGVLRPSSLIFGQVVHGQAGAEDFIGDDCH